MAAVSAQCRRALLRARAIAIGVKDMQRHLECDEGAILGTD